MTAVASAPRPATPPAGPGASPRALAARQADRGTVRHEDVRAQRWTTHGITKVVKGAEVGTGELGGTVVVGGTLVAERLTVLGSLEAHGPVTVAGRLVARGAFGAGASVRAGEATFRGPVQVAGELVVEGALTVRGALRAASVRCGRLDLRGTATVPGPVVATAVEATLVGESELGRVEGEEVRLRGPLPNVVQKVLGHDALATVERIDARSVRVEAARVGFVRAAEVVLGRNAHVGTLEGTLVRAHPTSRVGPESWSRPPPGLTR